MGFKIQWKLMWHAAVGSNEPAELLVEEAGIGLSIYNLRPRELQLAVVVESPFRPWSSGCAHGVKEKDPDGFTLAVLLEAAMSWKS